MKNWYSIIFSTVMRSAFADILVLPVPPGFDVRAQHDPEKNNLFFIFFILTQKILIRLLNILIWKLIYVRR